MARYDLHTHSIESDGTDFYITRLSDRQKTKVEPYDPAGTTFEIGRVEVTGRATGPVSASQVLSSVDVVSGDTLSDTTVGHAWEIFSRVPGIQLTNFNQGTTSGKISMRGFNGEGEIGRAVV